jgi:mono/diheme cytochrome c family protein
MRGLAALLFITSAILAIFSAVTPSRLDAQAQTGAALFTRCAACHLASRAGVPGAFPPLRGNVTSLAASGAGRRYLALSVIRGLSGPIMVAGRTYRGTMPAQGALNDAQVALVLNHLLAESTARPFSANEVSGYRAGGATLTSSEIARMRSSFPGI